MPCLRLGIEQVVYAAALYPTAIVDTQYPIIDSATMTMVRRVLTLPPDTPTAFLRWELRLFPAQQRGDLRALRFTHQLWHHLWLGKEVIHPLFLRDRNHPIFSLTPLRRLTTILARYGLSWAHVNNCSTPGPASQAKAQWSTLVLDRVTHHFASSMAAAAMTTAGLTPDLQAELHQGMRLATTAAEAARLSRAADGVGFAWELPLYHHAGGSLAAAGIRFRSIALRPFRGRVGRPACLWCGAANAESGRHLLACTHAPPPVTAARDHALQAIYADVNPNRQPPNDSPTSALNMQRLYHLQWHGTGDWMPNRSDSKRQPSKAALLTALRYMYLARHAYSHQARLHPAAWFSRIWPVTREPSVPMPPTVADLLPAAALLPMPPVPPRIKPARHLPRRPIPAATARTQRPAHPSTRPRRPCRPQGGGDSLARLPAPPPDDQPSRAPAPWPPPLFSMRPPCG